MTRKGHAWQDRISNIRFLTSLIHKKRLQRRDNGRLSACGHVIMTNTSRIGWISLKLNSKSWTSKWNSSQRSMKPLRRTRNKPSPTLKLYLKALRACKTLTGKPSRWSNWCRIYKANWNKSWDWLQVKSRARSRVRRKSSVIYRKNSRNWRPGYMIFTIRSMTKVRRARSLRMTSSHQSQISAKLPSSTKPPPLTKVSEVWSR